MANEKTLLVPDEDSFESDIDDLAEEILAGIIDGEYPKDNSEGGYAIEIAVLDYAFPDSDSSKETIADALANKIRDKMADDDDIEYGDLSSEPKVHFTEDYLIVG